MKDFKDIDDNLQKPDIDEILKNLNQDQKRILDIVTSASKAGNKDLLRLYMSGEGWNWLKFSYSRYSSLGQKGITRNACRSFCSYGYSCI